MVVVIVTGLVMLTASPPLAVTKKMLLRAREVAGSTTSYTDDQISDIYLVLWLYSRIDLDIPAQKVVMFSEGRARAWYRFGRLGRIWCVIGGRVGRLAPPVGFAGLGPL